MDKALNELNEYLNRMGNHKLEKLDYGTGYAIVRKSKSYEFGLDFGKIQEMGFSLSHMQSHNGKDEVVVFYLG